MKFAMFMAGGILLVAVSATAQLRSQADQSTSAVPALVHPTTSLTSFLGMLNPDNFMMRHNFSLSYLSFGGSSISLASYTNSMLYRIADPLNVRFDITLQGSPFGQYGSFQNDGWSRLYVSRAELNYRPTDNLFIKFQYNQVPFNYFHGYYPHSLSDFWGNE